MSDALFNHVFMRIMYMPKCSDAQLNYEINTISDKLSHQEPCCDNARPRYSRSIASLATI